MAYALLSPLRPKPFRGDVVAAGVVVLTTLVWVVTVRFAEAPVKGMSVLKYDPDGIAAHSYRQLAKEVLSNAKR